MKNVTILEIAIARGAKENEDGSITMGAVQNVGMPFLCGCQRCEASLACYNAYPSTTGYTMCAGCIEGSEKGFPSVAAFEAWCKYRDEIARAEELETIIENVAWNMCAYDWRSDSYTSKDEHEQCVRRVRESKTWKEFVKQYNGDGEYSTRQLADKISAEA